MKLNYQIVRTEKELADLVSLLYRYGRFVIDLETTGLATHTKDIKIVGAGFSLREREGFYVPFNYKLDPDYILKTIKVPLEDSSLGKINQNIKYDYRVLNRYGINLQNIEFDTMVASYCLFSDKFSHALDEMCLNHLGHIKIRTKSVIPKNGTMMDSPIEDIATYCLEDTDYTYRLVNYYKRLFELPEYAYAKKLFYDIELKVLPILCKMECDGVALDTTVLFRMKEEIIETINKLKKDIDTIAGEEVSLTKPAQIGHILYEKLKLFDKLDKKPKKTKTGKYATNEKALSILKAEPIVGSILQVKKLNKLLSTYVEPLPLAISDWDNLLHASFLQHITSTGRLSGADPNLQNQPKRDEIGKEIRAAFVSRFDLGKILSCDYSQQELRILAHKSGEPSLIEAFKANKDIHIAVASAMYKIPEDQVSKAKREAIKTIQYGIIYGMEYEQLAVRMNITTAAAAQLMADYMSKMTHVSEFLNSVKKFLSKHGYVENSFDRRRYLPGIYSPIGYKRAAALREGPNMAIQGDAADITKRAMREVSKYLEDKRSLLILQVHDELVLDLYPSEEYIKEDILDIMKNVVDLKVPMVAEGKIANNWMEAH